MKNLLIKRIFFSLLLGSICVAGQQLKAMEVEETQPLNLKLRLLPDPRNGRLQPGQIGLSYDGEDTLIIASRDYPLCSVRKSNVDSHVFDHVMSAMKNSELKSYYWKGYEYEESGKYDLATEAYDQMFAHISSEERTVLLSWCLPAPKPIVPEPIDSRPTVDQVQTIVERYMRDPDLLSPDKLIRVDQVYWELQTMEGFSPEQCIFPITRIHCRTQRDPSLIQFDVYYPSFDNRTRMVKALFVKTTLDPEDNV